MADVVASLTNAFTLAFVITSMFGLGLGLTLKEVVAPLKNARLVIWSLAANFVIVPAVAYLVTRLFPADADLKAGIILLSVVAGAPLAIKASQLARGDMRFAASLVALQVIVTVIYLPFALPLLAPGVEVDSVALALPLVLQILVPFALGILMNARYDEEAEATRPIMTDISNISLALMLVLNLTNVPQVLSLLGTGSIAAVLIVIAVGLLAGYWLGGPEVKTRRSLSIGTGQRNYAAAFVIAGGNFADRPTVFVLLIAASLISMFLVMLVAGEFGKRAKAAGEPGSEERVTADSPRTPLA